MISFRHNVFHVKLTKTYLRQLGRGAAKSIGREKRYRIEYRQSALGTKSAYRRIELLKT